MNVMSVTEAKTNLNQLVKMVNISHEETMITTPKGRGNAVLVSEEDWRGMQETACINSIPGLAEDIIAASKEPDSECFSREEVGF